MTAEYIKKQTKRLMQLPFAPSEEHDRAGLFKEFTKLAELHCTSEEHLTAVIDHLVATAQRCPPPAALVEAAKAIVPAGSKQPFGCEQCQGTGWYRFQKMAYPGGCDPYLADYCTFCSCEAGQWRKTKVREREMK